ncbi:MAG: M48 family metalloprotease [Tepidisphaeraceae bacterium]|jgi:STE24 endopeptidase
MLRFAILIVYAIWLYAPPMPPAGRIGYASGAAILIAGYVVLVLAMSVWSRMVRRVPIRDLQRRIGRINWISLTARTAVPAWFAAGLFAFGWKGLIDGWLTHYHLGGDGLYTPGLILGTLPAVAALMGLIWAQYPAEQSLREQNILVQLNEDLPFCAPPTFPAYFNAKFRSGMLFTAAPVIVLLILRDIFWLVLNPILTRWDWFATHPSAVDMIASAPATLCILILAPEILRRVLQTVPMPDSPLRRRLETICWKYRIGYRNVLLWQTSYQVGNAAVMGLVRQTRYVLLSDLLVETMSDEQIEAVFAHELGHVVHRHLLWLAATATGIMFLVAGPGAALADRLAAHWPQMPEGLQWALWGAAGLGLFAAAFGYVSRKFERQADVFAARTVQSIHGPAPLAKSSVGEQGAEIFCAALRRIAAVNNIPMTAASWSHGSIARRMRFLAELGRQPERTANFDRFMKRLYLGLVMGLCLCALWTAALVGSGFS